MRVKDSHYLVYQLDSKTTNNSLTQSIIDVLHTNIPLSPARLDMAAYTFSYHMNGGCALEKDPFWGNSHVRETLLKYRFKEFLKLSSYHLGKGELKISISQTIQATEGVRAYP